MSLQTSELSATIPARFKKAVFLSVDENYFPFAMFVADRLHRLNPERDFDICIVGTEDFADHPLIQEIGVRICRLEVAATPNLPTGKRLSQAAYLRLLAPAALADDYQRLLYLDADMMPLRGDYSALLDVDLGGHAIGAVLDDNQMRKPDRIPADFKKLGLSHQKYLNSGLLLIDTAKFNDRNIGEQAMALAAEHPEAMLFHDQSALNAVLLGGWAELSNVWNFQIWQKSLYFSIHFNPANLHFIASQKPWASRRGIYPAWILALYREFFKNHFPQKFREMEGLPLPEQKRRTHMLLLALHAVNFRRYIPNATRFADDMDVKL